MNFRVALLLICLIGPASVSAQSPDAATERARIANQRIQVEADRKAREEQQRLEEQARLEAEQARLAARQAEAAAQQERQHVAQAGQSTGAASTASIAPTRPASNADVSKVLDQLRTLGELKDAGYLTDEEFARIKKRLLDGRF